jgi:hypothetical protein
MINHLIKDSYLINPTCFQQVANLFGDSAFDPKG